MRSPLLQPLSKTPATAPCSRWRLPLSTPLPVREFGTACSFACPASAPADLSGPLAKNGTQDAPNRTANRAPAAERRNSPPSKRIPARQSCAGINYYITRAIPRFYETGAFARHLLKRRESRTSAGGERHVYLAEDSHTLDRNRSHRRAAHRGGPFSHSVAVARCRTRRRRSALPHLV